MFINPDKDVMSIIPAATYLLQYIFELQITISNNSHCSSSRCCVQYDTTSRRHDPLHHVLRAAALITTVYPSATPPRCHVHLALALIVILIATSRGCQERRVERVKQGRTPRHICRQGGDRASKRGTRSDRRDETGNRRQ